MSLQLKYSIILILVGVACFLPQENIQKTQTDDINDFEKYQSFKSVQGFKEKKIELENLVNHSIIRISHDDNFSDYDFQGLGTDGSPFLIENLKITNSNQISIYISNTTQQFIIGNCELSGYIGIKLANISSNTATIYENLILNSEDISIQISNSKNVRILRNEITSIDSSIIIENADYTYISSNYLELGMILIQESSNCIVQRNSFLSMTILDSNNTIITENISIPNNKKGIGIYVSESDYCQIINNSCCQKFNGIVIQQSLNLVIKENILCNNSHSGLILMKSNHSEIVNNICNYEFYGIYITQGKSNFIDENICNNNECSGICIWQENLENGFSLIKENICNFNFMVGIEFHTSNNFFITKNHFEGNGGGISLDDSKNGSIVLNLFLSNYQHGVFIYSMYNNHVIVELDNYIYQNDFVNNNLGGISQGLSRSSLCQWYENKTLIGNYWNDWCNTGNYTIEGVGNNIDPYPLSQPLIYIPPEPTKTNSNYISIELCISVLVILIIIKRKFRYKH